MYRSSFMLHFIELWTAYFVIWIVSVSAAEHFRSRVADVTMANMASACALVMSSSDSAKLFGPLRYWRARQAASTCILVTISAICVCILVVCGVLLAREYSLAKGYKRTLCGVSNVTDAGPERSCHFCSGHKDKSRDKGATGACVVSSFPCVRIYVVYNIGSTTHEALLHPDSIQAAGPNREVGNNQYHDHVTLKLVYFM